MSYLSNILASIGDDAPVAPAAASSTLRAPPPAPKRKAEDQLNNGPAKRPTTPANSSDSTLKRPDTPNNTSNGGRPKSVGPAIANPGPYKGSARVGTPGQVKKPDLKAPSLSTGNVPPSKTVAKPLSASPGPITPIGDKPAPKKGSYADLMARAKAAQTGKPTLGVIMHKQTDKTVKKERPVEGIKGKNVPLRDKKTGDRSRTGSAEVSGKLSDRDKDKRKSVEKSEYKGSAKSTAPIYTGSARPGLNKKPVTKRRDEYANWSDEEEMYGYGDDDEEEEQYESDGSDMEAGAFDVEREEQEALRQAKADDARELALEKKLQAEKRARLERLNEAAVAKKKRFL